MTQIIEFMSSSIFTANAMLDGFSVILQADTLLYFGLGMLIGMLVGAFPGVTATMTVQLASSFSLTMYPMQGMSVFLSIYVATHFRDRAPPFLIITPGTFASISTTFDVYSLTKQSKAGLPMTVSSFAFAISMFVGINLLA